MNEPSAFGQDKRTGTSMASHDLGHDARMAAAKAGLALPDGSYPMRDRAELAKAIMAIGRAGPHRSAVIALAKKRARALGAEGLIPDNWK